VASSSSQLFRPGLGAATIAVLTGGYLGHLVMPVHFGTAEQILAVRRSRALILQAFKRAACAIETCVPGRPTSWRRSRIATAQRVAAALLAVTAVCMGAARYA
jgi:hypothetical protein